MATLRAAVEATLLGKDERLVAKCNVPGILAVFERWDIYDVDTLSANLASSYAELHKDLAPVAALSFLALLKATISRVLVARRSAAISAEVKAWATQMLASVKPHLPSEGNSQLAMLNEDALLCVCHEVLHGPVRAVSRLAATCRTFHELLREDVALLDTLCRKAIGGVGNRGYSGLGGEKELLLTNKGMTCVECECIGRYGAHSILRGLVTLSIAFNQIDDQVIEAFATPRLGAWPALQQLILNGNRISCNGVIALTNAVRCGGGAWSQLRSLNLSYNQVGDRGQEALAEVLEPREEAVESLEPRYKHLPNLRMLLLMGNCGTGSSWRLKGARPSLSVMD